MTIWKAMWVVIPMPAASASRTCCVEVRSSGLESSAGASAKRSGEWSVNGALPACGALDGARENGDAALIGEHPEPVAQLLVGDLADHPAHHLKAHRHPRQGEVLGLGLVASVVGLDLVED